MIQFAKRISLVLLVVIKINLVYSQPLTQTFRGRVLDAYTGLPLPGVTLVILETDPLKGTTTNAEGVFHFPDLPLGRMDVKVSMVGYKAVVLQNLLLVSGRELVQDIRLEEQVVLLEDVEVRPALRKDQAMNEMAVVSARSFSVDETERYAGSLGDPSRMAANFAGVSSVSDQRNDIIIRGNSPLGLLWRLEGIEIPNPNHFGSLGSTGGPVSMINNNLLANSDFFTGAFPAEYGNALAGAFDLKMRSGNNQQYEFMGQVGFNGFELGAEGPFSPQSQASYLVHTRYSTLEALNALGMSFGTGAAIPKYQDVSLKINVPLHNGHLSFFGLGGNNNIAMLDSKRDDAQYGFSGTDLYYGNKMGVAGLNHVHYFNENARLTSSIAIAGIDGDTEIFDIARSLDTPSIVERLYEIKYTLSTRYSLKVDSRNFFSAGLVYDYFDVGYHGKEISSAYDKYVAYLDNSGSMHFLKSFAEWRHHFSDALSLSTGVHAAWLFLNESHAVEPRLGLQWAFRPGQSLNVGAGLHSQTQMRAVYFKQRLVDASTMEYELTNQHLDFTRSMHLVGGYNRMLGKAHRLKAEVYYQKLYNIPIAPQRPEFSLISQGGGYGFMNYDYMVNEGIAENKGIELTLEKFLERGFYYLVTASVFDAGYRGFDGIWRNSAFNNNFVINALSGYEWELGKRSLLSVDLKMVYAGGNRYLPIDVEQSKAENTVRYDWDKAFEERFPDYFRLNGRITFRLNGRSINQEWAIDLQNITNQQNIFIQNWDKTQQEVATSYQMGFMPMLTYRIYF